MEQQEVLSCVVCGNPISSDKCTHCERMNIGAKDRDALMVAYTALNNKNVLCPNGTEDVCNI